MIRGLLALVVVLGLMIIGAGARILALEKALAAKPKIEYKDKIVEKKVRVAGPVKIVKEIVEVPGEGRKVYIVEERAAVTTESDKASETEKREEPACPAPRRAKTRHMVGEIAPRGSGVAIVGGRAGMSFFDALPIAPLIEAGYRKDGQDRVYAGLGFRF